MRLIDADELKKELDKTCDFQDLYLPYEFEDLIDNAPTADDWQKFSDELWKKAYKEGYKQAIRDGKTNFSRPQGEWIVSGYIDTCRGYVAKCSCCKEDTVGGGDFCPNCGAKMSS